MAIYQVVNGLLTAIEPTTFSKAGYREREDLQRLLKQQIGVISPDTLIISEEFCDWADSRRRIDLLGIDKAANLVVIELKRTEDGGHMELQALRYSAMISAMTFDDAVTAFENYLGTAGGGGSARQQILDFLGKDEDELDEFPKDVRLVLASAEFSLEITTTVMWLNDYGLNIRCVRLSPYNDSGRLLIDVQQVIPLPEAEEFQIRMGEKKAIERAARTHNRDLTKFNVRIAGTEYPSLPKRQAISLIIRTLWQRGVDPDAIGKVLSWKSDLLSSVPGELGEAEFEKALETQVTNQGRQFNAGRFFLAKDELIHAHGRTYAVTTQWGERTKQAMDELLKAFPNHDIAYTVASN
jgi:hypothetical protein